MRSRRSLVMLAGLVGLVTACDGPCYNVTNVDATGRLGDTLVAVSRGEARAGTVSLRIHQESGVDLAGSREYAELIAEAPATTDAIVSIRLTRLSDPLRSALFQRTFGERGQSVSRVESLPPGLFDALLLRMTSEDLLFEVDLQGGTTAKALLNLEKREGPFKHCEPYT